MKLRRSFEEGHRRKLLIVVDESQEVESALYYAASRVLRSSGSVAMLYVIEPGEFQNWAGVRQVQLEEETTKAKALFRLFRRKLSLAGFENIETEEIIREGRLAEEILKLIAMMRISPSWCSARPSTQKDLGRWSPLLPRAGWRVDSRCPSPSCRVSFRWMKSRP